MQVGYIAAVGAKSALPSSGHSDVLPVNLDRRRRAARSIAFPV